MFKTYHCSSSMSSILLARISGYNLFVGYCCCCLHLPDDDIILAHRVLVTPISGRGFQCADNLGTWKVGGVHVALPQNSGSEGSVKLNICIYTKFLQISYIIFSYNYSV